MIQSKPRLTSALLGLIGGLLLVGGGWLAMLGGSWAYVVVGLGCIVTAVLLWRGRAAGVSIYWAMLLAIYGWSLWEVGIDGWALAPRLIAPTVLGLWLLVPVVRRGLVPDSSRRLTRAALALGVVVLVAGVLTMPEGWGRNFVKAPAGPAPAKVATVNPSAEDWKHYGGDLGASRYSGLEQITPANVGDLEVAWTARVGSTDLAVTPLKIGDTLYICNAANMVQALDPETGKLKWSYDPKNNMKGVTVRRCRGVAYFDAGPGQTACRQRVFTATLDARLIALDATTGRPCAGFGQDGVVDLKRGMNSKLPGYYAVTSAPTVVSGKVIFGGWVTDNQFVGEPSGVVRAYDAVTGELTWAWDVGRTKDAPPLSDDTQFTPGTPNVWGPISGDETLGLVYLPVGNSTPDYYGAHRSAASDAVASSVVAVDAATGDTRWVFQTTHHDVWDYDVASQPTLLDVKGADGTMTPAVLQTTKRGQIFLLDRRTGVPLAKVAEKPVSTHGAPGDPLSPTQPYSVQLPNFSGPDLSERDMWGLTPFDQLWCRIAFRRARYEGQFTPPAADARPTIQFPGFIGGSNWSGLSVDPERQLAVINTSRMANFVRTIPRAKADEMGIKPVGVGPKIGLISPQVGTPFAINTGPFLSPIQVPCQRPPFGMMAVMDLKSRQVLWSHPLGTSREVGPFGWKLPVGLPMGSVNLGGTLTTRSGLTFISATQDQTFRAFDIATGKVLWEARLPAGSHANPMTYRSSASGRQFVVVAAGGGRTLKTRRGDYLIAYALPERPAP